MRWQDKYNMGRIHPFLVIMVISFLCGCSAAKQNTVPGVKPPLPTSAYETRKLLIGKWLGEAKTDEGNRRQSLLDRLPNGTYKIFFRTYKSDASFEDQCEVGLWGFSGSVFFSIMRGWIVNEKFIPADPTDPAYYDAYEILKLTEQEFEYRHIPTNYIFRAKRVLGDYTLPEGK